MEYFVLKDEFRDLFTIEGRQKAWERLVVHDFPRDRLPDPEPRPRRGSNAQSTRALRSPFQGLRHSFQMIWRATNVFPVPVAMLINARLSPMSTA
jgi:hypothetical protein